MTDSLERVAPPEQESNGFRPTEASAAPMEVMMTTELDRKLRTLYSVIKNIESRDPVGWQGRNPV